MKQQEENVAVLVVLFRLKNMALLSDDKIIEQTAVRLDAGMVGCNLLNIGGKNGMRRVAEAFIQKVQSRRSAMGRRSQWGVQMEK